MISGDVKSPRFKALATAASILLFLVFIAAFIVHQQHNSPSYTQKIVDKDTGEIAYIQPNKEAEKSAGGGDVIVFGSSVLFDNGATQDQYEVFKSLINDYSDKFLSRRYDTITLVPKSVSAKSGDIKGRLRLGQGSDMVNVEIKLTKLYYVQLIIIDPAGHYKNYDSGIQPQNIQG